MEGREGEEEEEGAVVFTKGPLRQFVHFPTLICQIAEGREEGTEARMEIRPQI